MDQLSRRLHQIKKGALVAPFLFKLGMRTTQPLLELRKPVGDLEPGRLFANPDVTRGADTGIGIECTGAYSHHARGLWEILEQRRPAAGTEMAQVVRGGLVRCDQTVAGNDSELISLDKDAGIERRPGRSPAFLAMTVHHRHGCRGNLVTNLATEAASRKHSKFLLLG